MFLWITYESCKASETLAVQYLIRLDCGPPKLGIATSKVIGASYPSSPNTTNDEAQVTDTCGIHPGPLPEESKTLLTVPQGVQYQREL